MSLARDIRALIPDDDDDGTEVLVPSNILKQIRVVLVNSSRDDEETEFLLSQFKSRDPVTIEKHYLEHMLDFLRGEM